MPAEPLQLLHCDSQLLVINKPAGMPVHHAGRYRRNTLVEVLGCMRGRGTRCIWRSIDFIVTHIQASFVATPRSCVCTALTSPALPCRFCSSRGQSSS